MAASVAPRMAIDVSAITEPGDLVAIVERVVVALDIEASAGYAETVEAAHLRRDRRPVVVALAGVAERLVAEGLAYGEAAGRDRAAELGRPVPSISVGFFFASVLMDFRRGFHWR